GVAAALSVLLWGLAGCVLGAIAGVLPRIGPAAIMAMLLPATYAMQPVGALAMLAGVCCGAALDSFVASCVGVAVVTVLAPLLPELAFRFGPAEYFSLAILGLAGAVVLSRGSVIKSIAMAVFGMLLGTIGTDPDSGLLRFSFDLEQLDA